MTAASLRRAGVVAALLLLGPVVAQAGPADHLRCRRTHDPAADIASVDVRTLPFGLQPGCTVVKGVREWCEPAEASVFAEPSQPAPPSVEGEPLRGERLCYRIRCGAAAGTVVEATDRFGKRLVTLGRSQRLCVPARTYQ